LGDAILSITLRPALAQHFSFLLGFHQSQRLKEELNFEAEISPQQLYIYFVMEVAKLEVS